MGGRTLVYPVRQGYRNESLRYSLRSIIAHVPHDRVIIAGYRPAWVKDVEYISVPQLRNDKGNVRKILSAVCNDPRTPDEFILMNDDFFALTPNPEIPLVYTGLLQELDQYTGWQHGWYKNAMENTLKVLQESGIKQPLSYDRVHRPLPIQRESLKSALESAKTHTVLHRSLYGNLFGGGVPGTDTKIRYMGETLPQDQSWVSTSKVAWSNQAGQAIRVRFRERSKYERR